MTNDNTLALINRYRSPILGVAALWILAFHMWQPLFAKDVQPVLFYVENITLREAVIGVDMFFFFSGMGLTYAISKYSLGGFYLRRLKKLAVPVLVIAVVRAFAENWGFDGFLIVISGLNFYTGNMYFFLWFVTAIATLYIVFPLYWRVFSQAKSKPMFTLCFATAWFVLSLLPVGKINYQLYGFINRIPVFVFGVLIGWMQQNGCGLTRRTVNIIATAMLAAGLTLSFMCHFRGLTLLVPESNCGLPNLLAAPGLCVLLAEVFSRFDTLCHFTRALNEVVGFIGRISLEFYCVQEYFGGLTVEALKGVVPDAVVNLAVLAVVMVLAWLLHLLSAAVYRTVGKLTKKNENITGKA